ncbi:MAG: formylglycine-generating enzyme family protein [Kiritimatiellae bacterium]|nr:formylglycine-generating enzyme family protein [Kiritimatiellia bacterium]
MVKRAWRWLFAYLAAFFVAAAALAAPPEGPCTLPPGKGPFEKRTVVLPGGTELVLTWMEAGEVPTGEKKSSRKVPVEGFWIGVCEVTQKQWTGVMETNPSHFRGEELSAASRRAELPVECVSWDDAMEFCRRTGLRLPTEMEWLLAQQAARWRSPRTWTAENSGGHTHPAGRPDALEWGLFDMDGNVSEWCEDWFAPWPKAPAANYAGPATGTERVVCGGNWCGDEWFTRRLREDRLSLPPACRYNNVGFRVCLTPVPDPAGEPDE